MCGFLPTEGFIPSLMVAPFSVEEKERLAVDLEIRDDGLPFRPRDEIDELYRQIIFYMRVLFRVDRDDPVRVPQVLVSLAEHDEVGLFPEGDVRATVGEG